MMKDEGLHATYRQNESIFPPFSYSCGFILVKMFFVHRYLITKVNVWNGYFRGLCAHLFRGLHMIFSGIVEYFNMYFYVVFLLLRLCCLPAPPILPMLEAEPGKALPTTDRQVVAPILCIRQQIM